MQIKRVKLIHTIQFVRNLFVEHSNLKCSGGGYIVVDSTPSTPRWGLTLTLDLGPEKRRPSQHGALHDPYLAALQNVPRSITRSPTRVNNVTPLFAFGLTSYARASTWAHENLCHASLRLNPTSERSYGSLNRFVLSSRFAAANGADVVQRANRPTCTSS